MTSFEVCPLDAARWPDLEALFGPNGAVGGCWCMWFALTSREFEAGHGSANKQALRSWVESGRPVGLLAYRSGEPVGWASVAPRPSYERLRRSPLRVGELEEPGIWSMLCFFVHRTARRQGVSHALVEAGISYARKGGARVLEALPQASYEGHSSGELFHGWRELFEPFGFEAVPTSKPRQGSRIVMRLTL
jgi:GNAT superfamily N-acetyltransferase